MNWSSTEFDPIYADELAGFVPSLDSSAPCSDVSRKTVPKLSLDDNLGIADDLLAQQYHTINNIAVRQMVEGDNGSSNAAGSNNNEDNPVVLTQLLGLYVAQQNEEKDRGSAQGKLHDGMSVQTTTTSTSSTMGSISSVNATGNPYAHTNSTAARGLKRPSGAISSSGMIYDRRINDFSNFTEVSGFNAQQFAPTIDILEDREDDDAEEAEAQNNSTDEISVMTPKERRRERNKVLARKTRMKKKAELETLRGQVKELSNENRQLKMARYVLTLELLGNHRVPDNIRQRIRESSTSAVSDSSFTLNSVFNDNAMKSVAELLSKSQRSFCITNHNLPDQPIIYASPLFLDLTGYSAEEAVGRNCRFLQGRETNREVVTRIKAAIKAGDECNVALLNYRKNGSKFWNSIHLSPMKAGNGEVLLYVGIQVEITAEKAVQINSKTEDVNSTKTLTSSAGTDMASEVSLDTDDYLSIADSASVPTAK